MSREILTNRWFLGGCGFLIAFGIACYFWYQHELAPYRQQAADAQQQLEISRDMDIENNLKPVPNTPTENIKSTVSKPKEEADVAEDVRVSPFGFGPYPDVPLDFPEQRIFKYRYGSAEQELLARVRIKLWKEGIQPDGIGYLVSTGLYYPTVRRTVYVRWGEVRGIKFISRLRCHPSDRFDASKINSEEDIPSHLKVLDFSEGIDPYKYLNLSKEIHK